MECFGDGDLLSLGVGEGGLTAGFDTVCSDDPSDFGEAGFGGITGGSLMTSSAALKAVGISTF